MAPYVLPLILLVVGHEMLRVSCQITADVDGLHSESNTSDVSSLLPLRHKSDSKRVRHKELRTRSTSRQLNSADETHQTIATNSVSDSTLGNLTGDSRVNLDNNNTVMHWDEGQQSGILKMQNLRFQKILENTSDYLSTCYTVHCTGNGCPKAYGGHLNFCYPSLIITGLPKCGTSAMYELLSRLPDAVVMNDKENCPFVRRRSHFSFFQSLPRFENINAKSLIIDGCIDAQRNMLMRKLLREPRTLYVVLTRDYADMLWSSYNFWCSTEYDGASACDNTKWAVIGKHIRSPTIFNNIIKADTNGTKKNPSPMHIKYPCKSAHGFYSNFLTDSLWSGTSRNQTIVIASEELEKSPEIVLGKIAKLLKLTIPTGKKEILDLVGNFKKIRINSQDGHTNEYHRERKSIPISNYTRGVFAISGYTEMLNETRSILDTCWRQDCVLISQITGHLYPACMPDILELIQSGTWRSFNEIYRTEKDTYVSPHYLSGISYSTLKSIENRVETNNRRFYRSKKGKPMDVDDFKSTFTWPLQ